MLTSFLGWILNTLATAAEAEMNDETALREQLLEAEMRREMGEISGKEFREIEADLLARIREVRQRREGGAGPLTTGAAPIEISADSRFQIEAGVAGDFHEPAEAPHTTIVETEPGFEEQIAVLDMQPGDAARASAPGLPLSSRRGTVTRTRTTRTATTRLRRAPRSTARTSRVATRPDQPALAGRSASRTVPATPRQDSPTNADGERRRGRTAQTTRTTGTKSSKLRSS